MPFATVGATIDAQRLRSKGPQARVANAALQLIARVVGRILVNPIVINGRTIRTLVIVEIGLMAAGIAVAMLDELPADLERWSESQGVGLESMASLPFSVLLIAGYVGVVRFRRWGRTLYTWTMLAGMLLTLVPEAGVYTRWTGFFSEASQATGWILVALMHFSDARTLFDRLPTVSGTAQQLAATDEARPQ